MTEQKAPRRTLFQRIVGAPAHSRERVVTTETPAARLERLRAKVNDQRTVLQVKHERISRMDSTPLRKLVQEFHESDVADLRLQEFCNNTLERELAASGAIERNPILPSQAEDAQRYAAELPALARVSPIAAQMLLDKAGPTHDELAAAATKVQERLWIAQPDSGDRGFPAGMDPYSPKVPATPRKFPELREVGPVTSVARRFPELAPSLGVPKSGSSAGYER